MNQIIYLPHPKLYNSLLANNKMTPDNPLQNLSPRAYQESIFQTAKDFNTLVVLPTGLGKTLISLMLSIHRMKQFPAKKILMLAPTRPLVEQHFQTFKKGLPELYADIQIFTGSVEAQKRKKIFQTADIIFSTPQCVWNDLKKYLYSLEDVSLLIIDEAHRCLKNYDYTAVVNHYKQKAINQRILGLTASPGSDIPKVKEICSHLQIEKIEVRTRDSPDVKPYIKDREFQKVLVPFPTEFQEIKVLLKRVYDKKIEELQSRNLLFGPVNKVTLLTLQGKLAAKIALKDFNSMYGMTLTAQAIKISHAMELLETQTLSGLNEYFQNLLKQAIDKKSRAVQFLVKSPEFNAALISLQSLIAKKIEHPKVEELAAIVESEFSSNPNSKIIVFSQFRETASTISNRLNLIKNVNSSVFIGQAKKVSRSGNSTGLSQKEQKAIIEDFKEGKINVIASTSIAEEGLDIPEVSAVIFYEPIPSAIRKIQRAGRTARLAPGKLIILITEDTRDVAFHYASIAREKKMYKTIETVKQELDNKPKTLLDFK